MVKYRIKKLIDGYKVNPKYRGETLIAVPRTTGPIEVSFDDKVMYINNWQDRLEEMEFPDKYERLKNYTLGYFYWKPNEQIHLL